MSSLTPAGLQQLVAPNTQTPCFQSCYSMVSRSTKKEGEALGLGRSKGEAVELTGSMLVLVSFGLALAAHKMRLPGSMPTPQQNALSSLPVSITITALAQRCLLAPTLSAQQLTGITVPTQKLSIPPASNTPAEQLISQLLLLSW